MLAKIALLQAPLVCRGNLVLEQANNGNSLPLTPVPSALFLCSVFFSARAKEKVNLGNGIHSMPSHSPLLHQHLTLM